MVLLALIYDIIYEQTSELCQVLYYIKLILVKLINIIHHESTIKNSTVITDAINYIKSYDDPIEIIVDIADA